MIMKISQQDYEALSTFMIDSSKYLYREMSLQKEKQGYIDRSLIQLDNSMTTSAKIFDRIKKIHTDN